MARLFLAAAVTFLPALLHAAAPDVTPYAEVLRDAVKDGKVDYAKVRAKQARLDAYLDAVAKQDPAVLGGDAKAFYINAYNALVLRQVVLEQDARSGKLKSVLDVKGFFDGMKHTVAREALTLNELEEKRIRKPYGDPRVHFAVNCASASCPPLLVEPYATKDLDARLDAVTRAYLLGPEGIRLGGGAITASKLFEWYAGDFGGADGVRAFLRRHATGSTKAALDQGTVGFHEYGWALNAR